MPLPTSAHVKPQKPQKVGIGIFPNKNKALLENADLGMVGMGVHVDTLTCQHALNTLFGLCAQNRSAARP